MHIIMINTAFTGDNDRFSQPIAAIFMAKFCYDKERHSKKLMLTGLLYTGKKGRGIVPQVMTTNRTQAFVRP
jgi:hypothetical protein